MTLQAHLEKERKDEFLQLKKEKGWTQNISRSKIATEEGSQTSFRTPFTPKAFLEHLVNFIVADNQVS